MEEVAPPNFLCQTFPSRYSEATPMARKRNLASQAPSYHQQHRFVSMYQNPAENWNPRSWEWDSVRFVAKRLESDVFPAAGIVREKKTDEGSIGVSVVLKKGELEEDDERLALNLAGGLSSVREPPAGTSRPKKRVRSGSPGGNSYPMCQVDACKEDLSNAKDYHRRHKVCEAHSKSTEALVGKQMQRFCQQCSRFHPLSEFDEGKRSCRRRLAGHNRRRRKTQQDVTSHLMNPGNKDNTANVHLDVVNLLTSFAVAHGKTEDVSSRGLSVSDTDRLLQILSKINSLPLPADFAAKLSDFGINKKFLDQASLEHHNLLNGGTTSSSTADLLTVLSAILVASAPDSLAFLSQRSSQSTDSEKTKIATVDRSIAPTLRKMPANEFPSAGGEKSSTSYQSILEDSDCQIQETRPNLPLQLFSSSPEDDRPPKLASSRKYFSSDSSNPTEDRSPSSSPPLAKKLFPLHGLTEAVKPDKMSIGKVNTNFQVSKTRCNTTPLDLFGGSCTGLDRRSYQNSQNQAGYASSSGSDRSPSSLNSDAQDRTGRILFKLFDKDPSHLPGALRGQIYNWLSNSPTEMESYIRPGCAVLSLYMSMPSTAWEKFEENLLQHVNYLVQHSDFDIWRNGRFLVHTGRQLASHKQGKIRLCKSWKTWSSPELISVSPLAVVGGQETSLVLKGRNLSRHGTRIHCTSKGGYATEEVIGLADQGTMHDEIKLPSFRYHDGAPGFLGRSFIEVENGFKGNSFPVIIADAPICRELRVLESVFDEEAKICISLSEDQIHDYERPRSKEEVLHFLNELGWLFQKRAQVLLGPDFSLGRFKFLLTFSVERDWRALVRTILDILVERNSDSDDLSKESLGTLTEIQLLNRAVQRRCRDTVDLLINYSVTISNGSSKKYIFPPNVIGLDGLTPLHLAACTSGSDDMIDALTNDPQEIGLHSWNSHLDANGHSPYAYAVMRNNHSYNKLVARKLADRRNSQVSLEIENETKQVTVREREPSIQYIRGLKSCAKCSVVATKYRGRYPGAHGLLHRPYIHSMLAIAAVCVCVCLFYRGLPDVGSVAPFKWENLDFGTI